MRLHSKLLVLLMLFAGLSGLGGCATGPKYSSMTFPPIPPGQGRIFLYRDFIPVGLAVQPDIKVNHIAVGTSQPNAFCYVDRPAGRYDVTCMTEWEHKTTFDLAANETRYVHMFPMIGLFVGHICPEQMEPSKAIKAIRDCNYNGPPLPAQTQP